MPLRRWIIRIVLRGRARRVYLLDHAHTDGETRRPLLDWDAWRRNNGGAHW